MNFKLTLSYDGSNFSGWQIQPDERTIQNEIQIAIQDIFHNKDIKLYGSGRTDSGVHAINQTANFLIENTNMSEKQIIDAINSKVSRDIYVLDCQKIDEGFNSRYSAINREYLYKISRKYSPFLRKYSWYQNYTIDFNKLKECSEIILGEHDFSNFCKSISLQEKNFCNISKSIWKINDDTISYRVRSNRFLHHMVRMLVGTMVEVSKNRITLEEFNSMIKNPNTNKKVITAPALGLYLYKVYY
jgi:tRNA pseudouridine38-40 synthase